MLITKEQQEAMVDAYISSHNYDQYVGFIDGMKAMIDLMEKLIKPKTKPFKCTKDHKALKKVHKYNYCFACGINLENYT